MPPHPAGLFIQAPLLHTPPKTGSHAGFSSSTCQSLQFSGFQGEHRAATEAVDCPADDSSVYPVGNQLLAVCPILLLKALFFSSKKALSTPNLKSLMFFMRLFYQHMFHRCLYLLLLMAHTGYNLFIEMFRWLHFLEMFYKCSGK